MMEKILFGLCVLASGVFGADTKGEEKVSMMIGKLYTFHTDVIVGNTFNQIIWRFNGLRLAHLRGNGTPDYYPIFRDRPHVNQKTGDLSINVTSEHSGLYSLQIIINGKESEENFTFTANKSESSKPWEWLQCYNVGCIVVTVVVAVAVLVACPTGLFCCYKKYYKKPGHSPKEEFELIEVKSEETTALNNNGTGNGTLRTEDLP